MKLTLLILSIGLLSCANLFRTKHENLLSFESEKFRDMTLTEMDNGDIGDQNLDVRMFEDTMQIKVEVIQAGCDKFNGDIEMRGDTLVLMYWSMNETVCDEMVVYNLNYRILNQSELNYTLIKIEKNN